MVIHLKAYFCRNRLKHERMMKKYLFLLLIRAASLTACGDDDDPVVPELNKLTKVSCYKDGASSPLFTADINYTSDGKISNIKFGSG